MCAAFIMEVMHDKDCDSVVTAWNGGYAELIRDVMNFVAYLVNVINAVASACGDDLEHPCVLKYEAAARFGNWIATGSLPAPDA